MGLKEESPNLKGEKAPRGGGKNLECAIMICPWLFPDVLKKAAESGGAGREQKEGQKAQGAWHSSRMSSLAPQPIGVFQFFPQEPLGSSFREIV